MNQPDVKPKIDPEKGKALLYRTKELVENKDWDTFEQEIIPLVQTYWEEAAVPQEARTQMLLAMHERLNLLREGKLTIPNESLQHRPD
jgi:DNA phosphorothioation-dependent restriction protein DptG